MQLNIKSAKLSGNPSSTSWSQVREIPEDGLFILVSVGEHRSSENKTEVDRIGEGSGIAAYFVEQFENVQTEGVHRTLNHAFESTLSKFETEFACVDLAVVLLKENIIYIFSTKDIQAYILRGGNLVKLTNSSEVKKFISISGNIKLGDKFLIATQPFFSEFAQGAIKGGLESGDCGSFVEGFLPKVYANKNASQMAALVLCTGNSAVQSVDEPLAERPVFKSSRTKPGFKLKLVAGIDKILEKLPEKRLSVNSYTVDIDTKRRRKTIPLIGFILLLILGVSIVFGFRQHKQRNYQKDLDSALSQVAYKLSEAKSLSELDGARAKKLLLEARKDVVDLKESGVNGEQVDAMEQEIESSLGNIAGIYEQDPELYLDLSLISSGFEGQKLDMSGDDLVVLDKKGRKLVGIELASKRTEVISGPEYIPDAVGVSRGSGDAYILSKDGVREIGEEVALVVKSQDWNPQTSLVHWFAGNLYILDTGSSKIYRYPGIVGGFAGQEEWLASGINVDLSGAKSWTIDGDVWVLLDGAVKKFSRGVPQNFRISDEDNQFSFDDIYTQEEHRYLYLLDSQNSRVVVFTKDGNYKAEYSSSELNKATEIVVSEDAKKLVFLVEGKLYEIELKHL